MASRKPRPIRTVPLDEYDPWPVRLVVGFIGVIGLAGVFAVVFLKQGGSVVEGVIAIPVAAISVLSMLLPRRPPWSVRKDAEES